MGVASRTLSLIESTRHSLDLSSIISPGEKDRLPSFEFKLVFILLPPPNIDFAQTY